MKFDLLYRNTDRLDPILETNSTDYGMYHKSKFKLKAYQKYIIINGLS